ncbi:MULTISPECIES: TIGR04282 family arsenosugar biosynthesis glycosyltransferase [unclassified Spirosoma]|uniref:TIGR04282 family arsenosugar biosynthesis glycosyltransferase n=1 Tax=unclassified Spirosoma TaxID=2621999 RepID=UPI00095ED27E|nr:MULTISPECIES: TIGR04282 family arsenosugar biosynthesis glycosyltransferase [unclassified Spirosoma]MBN8825424.1 TIGR04282 family arsenosugar biosynthesis glycosyltransferase [Spirosoma sp.]OJW74935.1 MAG: glycosyltransferase [Spirosoma sp. 48-14]
MAPEQLIVFVKNPIPGQVKTRIARTVGDAKALDVYQHLLAYTQHLVSEFKGRCAVYYGDFVNADDGWNPFVKYQQAGVDLGERMHHAFDEQFRAGAGKVVIIGSDCFDITSSHIHNAFAALDTVDVVIGPATDGGYYLLGMDQLQPFLFQDMPWSQPELRQLTELAILQHGLTYAQLDELTDIDEWTDYEAYVQKTSQPL